MALNTQNTGIREGMPYQRVIYRDAIIYYIAAESRDNLEAV